MKNIKPRLIPESAFRAALFAHALPLVSQLDRIGGAVAVVFDNFRPEHPCNRRKVGKLLESSFPEHCGAFECTVDLAGQRWFILRAAQPSFVQAGVMTVLRRIGLLSFARVFVTDQAGVLVAVWPVPGERIDFSSVSLDLRPCAGLYANSIPAIDREPRPAIAGNIAANTFRKLLQNLTPLLAVLKPGKRLGQLQQRWFPARKPGTNST